MSGSNLYENPSKIKDEIDTMVNYVRSCSFKASFYTQELEELCFRAYGVHQSISSVPKEEYTLFESAANDPTPPDKRVFPDIFNNIRQQIMSKNDKRQVFDNRKLQSPYNIDYNYLALSFEDQDMFIQKFQLSNDKTAGQQILNNGSQSCADLLVPCGTFMHSIHNGGQESVQFGFSSTPTMIMNNNSTPTMIMNNNSTPMIITNNHSTSPLYKDNFGQPTELNTSSMLSMNTNSIYHSTSSSKMYFMNDKIKSTSQIDYFNPQSITNNSVIPLKSNQSSTSMANDFNNSSCPLNVNIDSFCTSNCSSETSPMSEISSVPLMELKLSHMGLYKSPAEGEPLTYSAAVILPPRCRSSSQSSSTSSSTNGGCVFCKKNGEVYEVYMGHTLHDSKLNTVSCPILRNYICPLCKASGDEAHTLSYCPYKGDGGSRVSATIALKSTHRQSNGALRKNKIKKRDY